MAHRLRYVPLVLAAVGAAIVTVTPGSRPSTAEAVGDNSMAPGLVADEAISVDRHAFDIDDPTVGEVVAFHPPIGEGCARRPARGGSCQVVGVSPELGEGIKRVVAGPGDRVSLRAGHVVLDGRMISEPYDRFECTVQTICNQPRAVTIPPGTWWLLADNRNAPNDSRRYGPIPTSWITGLVRQATSFNRETR
jgi:signal peptidase I